jgi:signal transduction histidine kinase
VFSQRAEVVVPLVDAEQRVVGFVGVSDTLESAASRFGPLRRYVVAVLAVALLLAGVVGVLLARRLAQPISQAAQSVVEIANGRTVQPLEPAGPQEIQNLSQAVNTLAERLRFLEETRRRSLANIVHELGRPLGAVRAAIHVLRQGAGDDPEIRQELLAGVEGQIERMEPLLDDLAQLHGQVSGQVVLKRQEVDLGEWLPPLLLPWRAAALDKGLTWHAQVSGDLPALSLDPDRMAQVVGNLLSNAIKYTPIGQGVTVSAGSDDHQVWICVADSGPGISPEERERIFEPFYRGQRDQRFPYGLGLGLTIARDLVEAHGGRLTLEGGSGEGSRFTVHLPLPA